MKKIKYSIYLITISILSLTFQTVFPTVSHAVDATTNTTDTTINTTTPTDAANTTTTTKTGTEAATQTQKIQNLKTRADTEIAKRLTALNSLIAKINTIKKLTADQKTSYTSDIQGNIASLTTLKTKIDADTDPTTLQSDVRSIIESYRIFAVYVPKIHILAGTTAATEMATSLSNLAIKIQTRFTADQQAGKDITTLQTELTDMQNKITEANNLISSVNATIITLTPSSYPGSGTILQTAQQSLKTIKTDLLAAKQDAQKIITSLKSESSTSNTTKK